VAADAAAAAERLSAATHQKKLTEGAQQLAEVTLHPLKKNCES
jgi:hypothetical protein